MTFINNRWYAIAWDGEVASQPLARTICGEPIVVYRKLDGAIVALPDRCPHRMLPLSMGLREGDDIRCRYHGLKIGPDGMPTEMPLKDDPINKKLCLTPYPVVEMHRFVWVWVGDAAKADEALVPNIWPCSAPGWVADGGYFNVKCDYRLFIDNLMDLTHETYVHMGSIGQIELMESPLETEIDGDTVTLSRWMPGVEAPPFWRSILGEDGPVDRWQVCEFIEPCSVLVDVGVSPVAAGDTLESHDSGVRGFVIDTMTPETETTCHYFWGMARNFQIDDGGVTKRIKDAQSVVFMEDVEVLEAQQKSIEINKGARMRVLNIDSGGAHSRKVIERLIKENA